MTGPDLEQRIREALRHRAGEAPIGQAVPRAVRRVPVARHRWTFVAVAAAAALVLVAGAVLVEGDEDGTVLAGAPEPVVSTTVAAEAPSATEEALDARWYLVFGGAAARYLDADIDLSCGPAPSEDGTLLQVFAAGPHRSPVLVVETVGERVLDEGGFGLVGPESGRPVTVRGRTGYVVPTPTADRAWRLSVVLPEGDALHVTALGLEEDDVVAALDGLARRADGGWGAPGLAPLEEQPASRRVDRVCSYTASADPGAGSIEVDLHGDRYDHRFQDRVASTRGVVEEVLVDGVPAALGSYAEDDQWLLLEPEPGHSLEVRASMSRDALRALLASARLVER
jgi:hypothetical protein